MSAPRAAAAPAAPRGRRPKVLVLNPNGVVSRGKQQVLATAVLGGKYDIVILPETHLSNDAEAAALVREWAGRGQPWRGEAFWSHGTRGRTGRGSCGVGVLLSEALAAGASAVVGYRDGDGRVLRVDWTDPSTSEPWSVLAVYAPNASAQQATFFGDDGPVAAALAAARPDSRVLFAGDFNCTLDAADAAAPAAEAANFAAQTGARALRRLVAEHGLTDLWQHAGDTVGVRRRGLAFTFMPSHGAPRRLDRVYASHQVLDAVRGVEHLAVGELPGDHCGVVVRLEGPRPQPPLMRPRRLPLYLLGDEDFCRAVREDIDGMQHRTGPWSSWADPSPSTAWEQLKARVLELALAFHRRKRRLRAEERDRLVEASRHRPGQRGRHAAAGLRAPR